MQTIQAPRVQLDPTRIASISGAIAVNGLVLLLLLAPMSPVVRDIAPDNIIVDYITKKQTPPPPPPPIEHPPIRVAVSTPAPTIRQPTHVVDPPPLALDDPQPGDTVVPPVTSDQHTFADSGIATPADDGKPLAGAHLEYATNPAPAYPSSSLRAQEQGTVMLEVLVDVDGKPIEVKIARSSGSRALDLAARRAVLSSWTFRPAMRDGHAVQAIGMVPVEFHLD
ncbi:energy transducer TonB [Lysobacter sp. HA35]